MPSPGAGSAGFRSARASAVSAFAGNAAAPSRRSLSSSSRSSAAVVLVIVVVVVVVGRATGSSGVC